MGRYDFRPSRVHQAAAQLLNTGRIKQPAWFDVVGGIPPSQILVRTPPVQHNEPSRRRQKRRASKAFMPQRITYEEDALRKQFFSDHPWELARPRTVLETDGNGYQRHDWSSLRQPTRKVDGESVVQRQLWLVGNQPEMTKAEAYDQARREFYAERLYQETEARVAKEEALATSAYFGKSRLQIGAELEDHSYELWRQKAQGDYLALEQKRASAVSSFTENAEGETPADEGGLAQAAVSALEDQSEIQQTDRGSRVVPSRR